MAEYTSAGSDGESELSILGCLYPCIDQHPRYRQHSYQYRGIDMLHALGMLMPADFYEQAVNQVSSRQPDECTYQQITRIMNAKIYSRVASKQCPSHHKQREPPLAEEEEDEECRPERIGGMARWKAETPATTAVDYVNHFRKGVIEIGRRRRST